MKKIIKITKLVFFRIKENPKAIPILFKAELRSFVRRNFYSKRRIENERLLWREELRKKMSPAKRRMHERVDIEEALLEKANI